MAQCLKKAFHQSDRLCNENTRQVSNQEASDNYKGATEIGETNHTTQLGFEESDKKKAIAEKKNKMISSLEFSRRHVETTNIWE